MKQYDVLKRRAGVALGVVDGAGRECGFEFGDGGGEGAEADAGPGTGGMGCRLIHGFGVG